MHSPRNCDKNGLVVNKGYIFNLIKLGLFLCVCVSVCSSVRMCVCEGTYACVCRYAYISMHVYVQMYMIGGRECHMCVHVYM